MKALGDVSVCFKRKKSVLVGCSVHGLRGGGERVTVVSLGVVSDVVDRAGEILIYGSVCNARSRSRSS